MKKNNKLYKIVGIILLLYVLLKTILLATLYIYRDDAVIAEFIRKVKFTGYGNGIIDISFALFAAWLSFRKNKWGLILGGILLLLIIIV